jgi:hypothetical protein
MLTAFAVAGALALATIAAPSAADARGGGRVAAGILGGLAAGALIAGAANGYYGGGPYYAYGPGPYYAYPRCYWRHERVWDGWEWRRARVRVCR